MAALAGCTNKPTVECQSQASMHRLRHWGSRLDLSTDSTDFGTGGRLGTWGARSWEGSPRRSRARLSVVSDERMPLTQAVLAFGRTLQVQAQPSCGSASSTTISSIPTAPWYWYRY